MNIKKATLHSDGGARGNPGAAGIGAVLKIDDEKTFFISEYIGTATNNQAEYAALKKGIEVAYKHKVQELTCYLDSELVVKQLKGEYKVKHPQLKPVYEDVKRLLPHFSHISFHHVMRAKNKKADELVNRAIDLYAENNRK